MELNLEKYKGLLVVGDVHSVFSDFATSYSYARKNNLYYLQLGDILDYGPKPLETMLLAKEILDAGEMDMTAMKKIQELYFEGNMNAAPALSGQSVGIIDSIKSAEDIINDTIKEFNETCSKLGGLKL